MRVLYLRWTHVGDQDNLGVIQGAGGTPDSSTRTAHESDGFSSLIR